MIKQIPNLGDFQYPDLISWLLNKRQALKKAVRRS